MQTHLDIETADPDDLFMLAIIANHPKVNLKAVSVFPGGLDQVSLVKHVLNIVGRKDIKVFCNPLSDGKDRVSIFYERWLGKIDSYQYDGTLDDLAEVIDEETTLLTGGPLKNILYLYGKGAKYKLWTCQGGFVGESIYKELGLTSMDKFKGKEKVATFNLNGCVDAAKILLSTEDMLGENAKDMFKEIRMVGKNICHSFVYEAKDVDSIPKEISKGIELFYSGADLICRTGKQSSQEAPLRTKGQVKAMHDLLAMAYHIDPGEDDNWVYGNPFRGSKGEWGFMRNDKSPIRAAVKYNKEDVQRTLFQ
jgi:inosine-uridine nucleoside N-ribohydrolase